jgi:hypothetical protein
MFEKLVVLLRCLLVPKIMHRGAPEVFISNKAGHLPYDIYCVGVAKNPTRKIQTLICLLY